MEATYRNYTIKITFKRNNYTVMYFYAIFDANNNYIHESESGYFSANAAVDKARQYINRI